MFDPYDFNSHERSSTKPNRFEAIRRRVASLFGRKEWGYSLTQATRHLTYAQIRLGVAATSTFLPENVSNSRLATHSTHFNPADLRHTPYPELLAEILNQYHTSHIATSGVLRGIAIIRSSDPLSGEETPRPVAAISTDQENVTYTHAALLERIDAVLAHTSTEDPHSSWRSSDTPSQSDFANTHPDEDFRL